MVAHLMLEEGERRATTVPPFCILGVEHYGSFHVVVCVSNRYWANVCFHSGTRGLWRTVSRLVRSRCLNVWALDL